MSLLQALKERILIGDGAMGTLLYSYGIDRCFEELNFSHEEEVLHVHQAYVEAGADIIQTNTYGANYIKLSRYGLEDEVKKINSQAVRIAKKAKKDGTFVVGTIGGIRGFKRQAVSAEEIKRSFREQLYCLLLEGVDGLLLETYYDFEELTEVLKIAREETGLPVLTHVSMHEPGILQNGKSLDSALQELEGLGADVVGVNCRLGPYHMVQALETVPIPSKAFLSAYPNASLPEYRDGKLFYQTETDYFKKCAAAFRDQGVRLLGGCCGTTPEHIKAFAEGIKFLTPLQEKEITRKAEHIEISQPAVKREPPLFEKAKTERSVIVEFDAPKHLDTKKFFEGAKALKASGIDAITLADNSLATPRISNAAIASILKQNVDLTPLVHITCRDRNLIGLQSHLMGLHVLGIHEVLAVTGDPTKIGDFPGASSVYDVSSFDLIQLIKQFNQGLSFSGKTLKQQTVFSVAAAFNPNVHSLDRAVKRMEKKIAYGADYFITQPIFDHERILALKEATKHLDVPIYIGIMPLTSSKNAEFLHNEVPGMRLTDDVRNRIAAASIHPETATKEGIAIAKELIDTAMEHFNGIYLITPFTRYDMTVQLTHYIREKAPKQREGLGISEHTFT
ncbi:homocysteine S-methyltransferase [Scopulibacillus darangshiensis]|uniref:Homocysteine S-methyltransferase n=1 Tax=Scopulibacillus darangshiensis TaxID=442528 RepID=A0A4R2NG61_9BACL|nr:bifunctional homocysteine S-methyltransferase/methylenetetrahydrofolate reductase [Scopulibacillus darangshiensis]TCP20287.1 homocysteine S-methyltransferase [Scopulibacillus darangshiensis]